MSIPSSPPEYCLTRHEALCMIDTIQLRVVQDFKLQGSVTLAAKSVSLIQRFKDELEKTMPSESTIDPHVLVAKLVEHLLRF